MNTELIDISTMWQPIETAPKDGSTILLYRPDAYPWFRVHAGHWVAQTLYRNPRPFWGTSHKFIGVIQARDWVPTHWMPLPDAPK
jgi:hypothetical protein